MAKDNFEQRFFDLLQSNLDSLSRQVTDGFKTTNQRLDRNTKITESVVKRVDKLDGKVFGKKSSSLSNFFGDRQIVAAFAFALLVFLLILASVLHVRIPTL